MKVLETQSAVLSNYEVLAHLKDVQRRYAKHPDYEPTVTKHWRTGKEVKVAGKLQPLRLVVEDTHHYLTSAQSPLVTPNATYSADSFRILMQRLKKYNLTKTETLMIFNLRPASVLTLDVIVEELDVRLSEQQQEEIVQAVADVLGSEAEPEAEADGQDMDVDRQ